MIDDENVHVTGFDNDKFIIHEDQIRVEFVHIFGTFTYTCTLTTCTKFVIFVQKHYSQTLNSHNFAETGLNKNSSDSKILRKRAFFLKWYH